MKNTIYNSDYGELPIKQGTTKDSRYRGTQFGGCGDECSNCEYSSTCATASIEFDIYVADNGDGEMYAVKSAKS